MILTSILDFLYHYILYFIGNGKNNITLMQKENKMKKYLITIGLISVYDKMVSELVIQNTDILLISTGEAENSTLSRPGNGIFISTNSGNTWEVAGLQGYTMQKLAPKFRQQV